MFSRDMMSSDESRAGLLVLTAVSIALTVPFIFYFKSMADSLHTIAEEKADYKRIKKYGD
ncbi:MAG: hypothetical protein MJA84_09780 [Firmicutes bacterium]|nr:hypothetical protein [Bacillota bacterium]